MLIVLFIKDDEYIFFVKFCLIFWISCTFCDSSDVMVLALWKKVFMTEALCFIGWHELKFKYWSVGVVFLLTKIEIWTSFYIVTGVTGLDDGHISTSVYRKSTPTDYYPENNCLVA